MTPQLWAWAATGAVTLALAGLGTGYLLWVWRHRSDYPNRPGSTSGTK